MAFVFKDALATSPVRREIVNRPCTSRRSFCGQLFPQLRLTCGRTRASLLSTPPVGPSISSPILRLGRSKLRVKPPHPFHTSPWGVAMPSPEQLLVNRCYGLQRWGVHTPACCQPPLGSSVLTQGPLLSRRDETHGGKGWED